MWSNAHAGDKHTQNTNRHTHARARSTFMQTNKSTTARHEIDKWGKKARCADNIDIWCSRLGRYLRGVDDYCFWYKHTYVCRQYVTYITTCSSLIMDYRYQAKHLWLQFLCTVRILSTSNLQLNTIAVFSCNVYKHVYCNLVLRALKAAKSANCLFRRL